MIYVSPIIPKFGIHTYRALINCPFPISPRHVWPNITLLFLALITPLRNSFLQWGDSESLLEDLFRNIPFYTNGIGQISCLATDRPMPTFTHTNMPLICIELESLKIALLYF